MTAATLLIVEDEAIVAENLAAKLKQLGYEPVGIAAEAEAAVDMALSLKPRLVLMDIHLQGGLDGIAAAGMIQERCDIPIIFLTAHSDPATLARAKVTGPFGYVLKPFEMRDLATQIELALFKHEAERQLRDQRELLRVTLTSIGDAVIATDADGRVTFINPVAETLTGWPAAEATGRPLKRIFRIVNEHTRAAVDDPVDNVLRLGKNVGLANHTILIGRDGREVPIDDSGAPIRDRQGRILGAVLVFRDISERRKAASAVVASENTLRIFIEHAPAALAMFDRKMHYLSASRRWSSDYDLGDRELIGRSHYDILPEIPERWKSVHRRALDGEVVQARSDRFERADGSVQWLHWEVRPWRDQAGEVGGIVIFSEDITAQKQSESEREKLHGQLAQAQKMESVGRLAGGVAHDFNNMLSIILGHAELAMEQLDPASPLQDALAEIRAAGQRSADLTRQLLAFARKQAVSPKVLDLNDTVTDMIKMLRRLIGEDIELMWMPGADLMPVKIDPAQIDQILANLCVNARDAIHGVGKITIETKNVTLDEGYCGLHAGCAPGDYVLLAVGDDGCGMDKETLDHVFEPFFTTKGIGEGTGLGLSTVYGIVKQNDGYVEAYSEPGHGALFKLYLPGRPERAAGRREPADRSIQGGTETVLLVEDEGSILRLATAVLRRYGYTVITAQSPAEALSAAEASSRPIHLLVTDVVMPGMNGRQLAARIREHRPDAKVLYMSGYTADAVVHRGILEADVQFLQKPFSNQSLALKVREVLDQAD